MDQQSHKLHVFHTVNEFKAHRRNRTELCKLDFTKNTIMRERILFEKDFSLRSSRLKVRKESLGRVSSMGIESSRNFARRVPESSDMSRIPNRSRSCHSTAFSGEEALSEEIIYGTPKRHGRPSTDCGTGPRSIFQTDPRIVKATTPRIYFAMPLREHSTTDDLATVDRESHEPIPRELGKGCQYPSKDNLLLRSECIGHRKCQDVRIETTPAKMIIKDPTFALPSGRRTCSLWSRKSTPSWVDIQRKVGLFLREQTEYNMQNPVNEEVVVHCEALRRKTANRVEISGPRFVSRREAMIAEVLDKLGLEERLSAPFPIVY